jgi:hypothetical protein
LLIRKTYDGSHILFAEEVPEQREVVYGVGEFRYYIDEEVSDPIYHAERIIVEYFAYGYQKRQSQYDE